MRRRAFVAALGAAAAGGWARLVRAAPRGGEVFAERWSWAMGQPVHVMAFAASEDAGLEACAAALAELRRVEARLTLFDQSSDLAELNRRAGRGSMRVDRDLRRVLELAAGFQRDSGGVFNVAVEPLMRVWGFHRPRRGEPTAAEIAAADAAVRSAIVRLDGDRVALPSAHTQLDFGGIGVGYGIDRAVATLRSHGITRAFLDVSGDCYALGAPPGRSGWPVSVVDPLHPGATLAQYSLADLAIATSANTTSVVRYGRHVRGHVMDPATGYPANVLLQASVVTRRAVAADALSKTLLVTGREPAGVLRTCRVPLRAPA
jgi:thiamine biosynthesis lipoprotein